MSDLISRKTLLEAMEKKYDIANKTGMYPTGLSEAFIITERIIREQPTAYDVDKVVERLEERKTDREKEYKTASLQDGSYMLSMVFRESAKAYERAIEIVKGGGVDE